MPFSFQHLEIPGVVLVTPSLFPDQRGWFCEWFKASDFAVAGIVDEFVQDNHAHSLRGVLRGLHYQKEPRAQAKLVRCVRGEIFDVVVDLRRSSPTFGRWIGELLSSENHRMLYVPAGCAHGYCVLTECADVLYKAGAEYSPSHEAGVRWNDPQIGIVWPVPHPVLSEKDAALPLLKDVEVFS